MFINDSELSRLLKDYAAFKDEDKSTVKRFIKAFSFYSKIEEKQLKMAH